MFSRVVPLCVVFLVFAAFTPAQDAKKDLEAIQGEWTTVSVEQDGAKIYQLTAASNLTIKGEQWMHKLAGIKDGGTPTFKIDPSKNPKTIDLTYSNGTVSQGIYKLEDGVLTMCGPKIGAARPAAFTSDGAILFVFKRAKK